VNYSILPTSAHFQFSANASPFNSDFKMKRRLFVLTQALPKPDTHAGDLRFYYLLEMLAREHEVDLCLMMNDATGLRLVTAEAIERYKKLLKDINVNLLPFGWRHVEAALLNKNYDLGFFEIYISAERYMELFRRLQPGVKVVIDTVDVHFARESGGAELGLLSWEAVLKNKEAELGAYRRADALINVTSVDSEILRGEGGMPPMFEIPILLPIRPRQHKSRDREVLFIGGFRHQPNLDGLLWFTESIWPLLHDKVPGVLLTIIGSNPPPEIFALRSLRGVNVLGFVLDVIPYLERAMVSIAPLRFGAGMKGKVIEAMAAGVPVVTTSFGVQGLGAVNGEHLLVADEPAAFAEHLISLLENPQRCERMGLAGQTFITNICSLEKGAEVLGQVLEAMNVDGAQGGRRSAWNLPSLSFQLQKAILAPLESIARTLVRLWRQKSAAGAGNSGDVGMLSKTASLPDK
jgi:glycosyltransferase involved in cell wall biosynthesis